MQRLYALGFSAFPGIGTRRFEKLIDIFGLPEKAWKAEESALVRLLGKQTGKRFVDFRSSFNIQKYAADLALKKIHFFIPSDKEYPILLKQLDHPPFILFAKGNVSLLRSEKTIGIVGTRKATSYGKSVTEMLVRDLIASGFTIVSGMALGVDGIAHAETIRCNAATIAVLGSGVDMPTPREHAQLYQKILDNNGLIVSTFSPGETASKGSFPARNAVIAGLSKAILVTEGTKDSGSLITARYAKQFGRPVFAVPGQITSYLSEGTNNLIKEGAVVVSSIRDIIGNLQIDDGVTPDNPEVLKKTLEIASKEESFILNALATGPLLFDEIVRTIGKDSKSIGSLLGFMELKGLVKLNAEGKYSI